MAEPDGTLVYPSPSYARHLGMRPEVMLGRSLLDFVGEADREAVRGVVGGVFETGSESRNGTGRGRPTGPSAG